MRIVSLIPSATEIVAALGFADQLVGRSHECDHPAGIVQLPALTAPKFDPKGSSREIDDRVQLILQESLSVYRVDDALLAQLHPDVIITQAQCEVCAVSLDEVKRVAQSVLSADAHIVSLEPNTLADVLADIERVASALGVAEHGMSVRSNIEARMTAIAAQAADLEKVTVATVEWIDPLMAAGNWMPELIEMAGGINLFGKAGAHSPWMEWDDLWAADPDRIIVLPCGYDIDKTRQEMPALTSQPGWATLRAVRDGHVYLTDGNQFFNRPGPRLLESLEILAEILHPTTFNFGHSGSAWVRLEDRI